jgi:Family of unknown function (DUF6157)
MTGTVGGVRHPSSVGYTNTFIAVAEDCRATTGEAPPPRGSGPTVAGVQHAMLAADPGRWTQEDVLIASAPGVRGRTDLDAGELERLKDEYFAEPRACLRASPLGKTYGWGLQYDAEGRITLHAVGSESYARAAADPGLTQLRAMRSKRG